MNYQNVENEEATYTALNRTREDDKDHVYCHLNMVQQENMNEAETVI